MPRNVENGNIIKTVFKANPDSFGQEFPELVTCVKILKENILSLDYLRKQVVKKRIQEYIASGFNYSEAVSKLNKLGDAVSYDGLKSSVCYCNQILKQKYGDVCRVIKTPTANNVKKLARVLLLQDTSDLLIEDLIDLSDETYNLRFELSDCKPEIALLMLLSKHQFSKFVNGVDYNKLKYLVTLLENPAKDVDAAWVLKSYLQPEIIDKQLNGRRLSDFSR